MVELDQYRYKISDYDKPLQQIKNSLDLDNKQKRIEELEADMEAPGFWDDTEKSQKAMKELKALKDSFEKYDALVRGLEDTKTLIEMAEEENDASLLPEIDSEIPADTCKVKVNYKGTLIDGTEFDSSYKRNEPATFRANQVIKGWTEALTMMPVGSKWELYIPQDLAYGARESGGQIKPFSTLIFEVELLSIEKDKK